MDGPILKLPKRSWRDVPMPAGVAALPRAANGMPVPYVAAWEGEDDMVVEKDEAADGAEAVFPRVPRVGKTRPVFGEMEPSRQRAVVRYVLCQVCAVELGPMWDTNQGQPLHWLIDMMHEPSTLPGHMLVLEPWVCDDCMVYALQVCPGLLGRPGKKPPRNVLAVRTSGVLAATIKPQGKLAETRTKPCIGYLKIEPLEFRRIRIGHFLSYGPADIREMLEADNVI